MGENSDQRDSEVYNITKKLHSREIGKSLTLRNNHAQLKFRNFQLQKEFDTNQASKIVQIVTAGNIIFALTGTGVCAAIDRETNRRLCYMNLDPNELIQRLYYNKENNSLVTIFSRTNSDRFSMKCRTTPLEYIRRAQPEVGFPCFDINLPGSVMFNDINGKAITFNEEDHTYKVFDLKNYTFLFSISDREIEAVRITSGIMLLISKLTSCGRKLHLKIVSIEDGTVLKCFHHALVPNKNLDYLELLHEKIFIKQENECLQMVDVQTDKTIQLGKKRFNTCKCLHGKRLFLAFHKGSVVVLNLKGEVVRSYRNYRPDWIDQFTRDEELLVSYNRVNCSIRIMNILTGDYCAQIGGNDALQDIISLFYDEESNEIYTGNKRGFVHVWSN